MFNYLKSDLYILKKMKITYILPAIFLVLMLFSNFIAMRLNFMALGMNQLQQQQMEQLMTESTADDKGNLGKTMKESFEVGFKAGYESSSKAVSEEEIELPRMELSKLFSGGALYKATVAEIFETTISGLNLLMFVAIFSAFFYGTQMKGAYMKNILKVNENRWVSYFSKQIVVLIYTVFFFIVAFLTSVLSVALMGKSFVMGFTTDVIPYLGLQLLLTFAMTSITGLVSYVSNTGFGMVFSIVTGAGLLNLLFMLIDILVNNVIKPGADFATSRYLITGNAASVAMGMDASDMVRPIIVACVFLVIGVFVTGIIHTKKDVH